MQIALSGAVSPLALAYTVVGAAESGCGTPTAAAFRLVEILGCLKAARVFEVPEKPLDGVATEPSGDGQ